VTEVGECDHLVARDETEVHRDTDGKQTVLLLVYAEVVPGRRRLRQREVFEAPAEAQQVPKVNFSKP